MKKQYRVKKSKEIEEILKNHHFSSNPYFTIYIKEQHETNHFRYAMSVGKKIGNAVVRNHLKRQIRAVVRTFNVVDTVDVFIVARGKVVNLEFQEIERELKHLFQKQKLLVKGEKNDSIFK
ncbi:MAG: ribonuclease P protein component [Anaeroplasmataceae bacterium]|nr:ribonuclease P protein component [Anaeroplasmataceae bacterium]